LKSLLSGVAESIAVLELPSGERAVTLLGLRSDSGAFRVRAYEGSKLYALLESGVVGRGLRVHFNFSSDFSAYYEAYAKTGDAGLECSEVACTVRGCYLVLKGSIGSCSRSEGFFECSVELEGSAAVLLENLPLPDRLFGLLLESLVHLSRVECASRGACKAGPLGELCSKLAASLWLAKRLARSAKARELVDEVERRSSACRES